MKEGKSLQKSHKKKDSGNGPSESPVDVSNKDVLLSYQNVLKDILHECDTLRDDVMPRLGFQVDDIGDNNSALRRKE